MQESSRNGSLIMIKTSHFLLANAAPSQIARPLEDKVREGEDLTREKMGKPTHDDVYDRQIRLWGADAQVRDGRTAFWMALSSWLGPGPGRKYGDLTDPRR
ncbi:hypothetical protein THAOC_09519 [Thalassiosira oceanica]|uniref:Uncharacterized protein n=1 Tax=Thalassiosira oceanica TaxID=159749 RepID=K0SV02_THAOC|nr:hypothetical protein THAOC_09519 [Thalassiosira oceanica]|eukprot:EJK69240.1 hypothetical protein THAOC_09519 [Thalassiosira oceanica]